MEFRKENIRFWSMTIIFSLSMTLITCFSHYIKVNPDTDMFRICKSFVFYNKSPSIPRGIYLRVPRLWVTSGDYVIYSPPSDVTDIAFNRGWIKSKKITFIKRVRGLAGDTYSADLTKGFCINNRFLGNIAIIDGKGRLMPMRLGEYHVPHNEFLPMGDNPASFDGRYTGTVPMDNIKAKVIPIFTEMMIP